MPNESLPNLPNQELSQSSPQDNSQTIPPKDPKSNLNLLDPIEYNPQKIITVYQRSLVYLKIAAVVIPLVFLVTAVVVNFQQRGVDNLKTEKQDFEDDLEIYGNLGEDLLRVNHKIQLLKASKSVPDFEEPIRKIITLTPSSMNLSYISIEQGISSIQVSSQSPLDFAILTNIFFNEGLVQEIVLKTAEYDVATSRYIVGLDLNLK